MIEAFIQPNNLYLVPCLACQLAIYDVCAIHGFRNLLNDVFAAYQSKSCSVSQNPLVHAHVDPMMNEVGVEKVGWVDVHHTHWIGELFRFFFFRFPDDLAYIENYVEL